MHKYDFWLFALTIICGTIIFCVVIVCGSLFK